MICERTKELKNDIISSRYKNGDKRDCKNFGGLTLSSVRKKKRKKRVRNKIKITLEDTRCGFMKTIFTIRHATEKLNNKNRKIHIFFIDLEKAFDKINKKHVETGVKKNHMRIIKDMPEENTNKVEKITRNKKIS
ncbi:hypothetical protein JTB14_010687 [Gonioctena quinquepunctata]|nr:hypothetical protein JTB14_010687 [Gonioctena quinquepunctata]